MSSVRVVVFGDSVSVNFPVTSAGSLAGPWPAAELEAKAYPELVVERLAQDLGTAVDLVQLARLRQTVKISQHLLAEAIAGQPTIVILAHGGHEALFVSPRRSKRLAAVAPPALLVQSAVAQRVAVMLGGVRNWSRCRLDVSLHKYPRPTGWVLRRLGFRSVMVTEEYEARLREVVSCLLRETHSTILLLAIFRKQVGTPLIGDTLQADLNDAAARRLAAENPERVIFSPRPAGLSDPANYLPDGAHLSRCGHALAAEAIIEVLRNSTRAHLRPS